MVKGKLTLCLDFDGVLHQYSKGWYDGSIYDPPTPGAQEFVTAAMERFDVVVYSSRAREDPNGITDWLKMYGFPDLEVTAVKPPAFLTIDDRAITFTGLWPEISELVRFKVWNKL